MDTLDLTKKGWVAPLGMGAVGDGRTIHPVPMEHKNRLVCEYWRHDTRWDWDLFSSYLPNELLKKGALFELVR